MDGPPEAGNVANRPGRAPGCLDPGEARDWRPSTALYQGERFRGIAGAVGASPLEGECLRQCRAGPPSAHFSWSTAGSSGTALPWPGRRSARDCRCPQRGEGTRVPGRHAAGRRGGAPARGSPRAGGTRRRLGSGLRDLDYEALGAEIVDDAATIFGQAELVVKVKEPQPEEISAAARGADSIHVFSLRRRRRAHSRRVELRSDRCRLRNLARQQGPASPADPDERSRRARTSSKAPSTSTDRRKGAASCSAASLRRAPSHITVLAAASSAPTPPRSRPDSARRLHARPQSLTAPLPGRR